MVKKRNKTKSKHGVVFLIIILFAVILIIRGIFGLMNTYLFPNNHNLSLWISLFLGFFILILILVKSNKRSAPLLKKKMDKEYLEKRRGFAYSLWSFFTRVFRRNV